MLVGVGGTEGIAVGVWPAAIPAAIGEPQVPQNREWTAVRCPEGQRLSSLAPQLQKLVDGSSPEAG